MTTQVTQQSLDSSQMASSKVKRGKKKADQKIEKTVAVETQQSADRKRRSCFVPAGTATIKETLLLLYVLVNIIKTHISMYACTHLYITYTFSF